MGIGRSAKVPVLLQRSELATITALHDVVGNARNGDAGQACQRRLHPLGVMCPRNYPGFLYLTALEEVVR